MRALKELKSFQWEAFKGPIGLVMLDEFGAGVPVLLTKLLQHICYRGYRGSVEIIANGHQTSALLSYLALENTTHFLLNETICEGSPGEALLRGEFEQFSSGVLISFISTVTSVMRDFSRLNIGIHWNFPRPKRYSSDSIIYYRELGTDTFLPFPLGDRNDWLDFRLFPNIIYQQQLARFSRQFPDKATLLEKILNADAQLGVIYSASGVPNTHQLPLNVISAAIAAKIKNVNNTHGKIRQIFILAKDLSSEYWKLLEQGLKQILPQDTVPTLYSFNGGSRTNDILGVLSQNINSAPMRIILSLEKIPGAVFERLLSHPNLNIFTFEGSSSYRVAAAVFAAMPEKLSCFIPCHSQRTWTAALIPTQSNLTQLTRLCFQVHKGEYGEYDTMTPITAESLPLFSNMIEKCTLTQTFGQYNRSNLSKPGFILNPIEDFINSNLNAPAHSSSFRTQALSPRMLLIPFMLGLSSGALKNVRYGVESQIIFIFVLWALGVFSADHDEMALELIPGILLEFIVSICVAVFWGEMSDTRKTIQKNRINFPLNISLAFLIAFMYLPTHKYISYNLDKFSQVFFNFSIVMIVTSAAHCISDRLYQPISSYGFSAMLFKRCLRSYRKQSEPANRDLPAGTYAPI